MEREAWWIRVKRERHWAEPGKHAPGQSVSHDHWTDKASILSLESLKVNAFGHFIQPIAIIMIEGYRERNKLTPLGLPSLWLMLFQHAGIGGAMPFYYLIYTLISDAESYWWPLRRFVPLHHASYILSAYVMSEATHVGLVLSTMYLPKWMQAAKSFWPLLVPVLVGMLGSFYDHKTARNLNTTLRVELKILIRVYLAAGLFGTLYHWFAIMQAVRNVDLDIILNFSRPIILEESLHILVGQQGGLLAYFLASYVWTVQAIWDLNRVGRANTNLFTTSLWIMLAFVTFGPSASVAGVWYI
ncbi:hypothetical protein FVEG_08736 [Fusarium verticillioides 7600]|uniref:Uncharacterized protein n=1 Tax=Gibberella moniliformis (strain M3125 / FGSC 7600) TaxID=334819 RepID=W7MMV5_GIBM7|nr:hypothetical protein FVEG_08736 [Fusarium verticillioides 7600]EWG49129.1 hypothetical protein FVEG_08736 [Fusarium verticillioides 7600]